ncbi:MAG: bifunctional (p)ppGpp synthetase/guanosine-3',5'-bis(diphosphate) 3'-pyrophosphohydrolase [Alphaproteobacteria bacterium]|nr:bifunctional (p)ppGpp synthetase/guanosine-3',5'-bis(diphosphate) 3'-pyrophosphohydrolase [Alphaproteobacteria bacterium]
MSSISEIIERIQTYSPDADVGRVMDAYLISARAHAGQKRKSGEPYLSHPIAVAMILADLRMDVDTIATALLHDALEDNPITKEEMAAQIGVEITDLVDGVTKMGKLKFRSKEELAAENFRKMMLAMSKDLRVILVKLADRTHNMQTLEHHRPEKQKEISRETMEIFVPIANRLGITRLKTELEDLCFRYLEPEAYLEIDRFLDRTAADREAYTSRVVSALQDLLHASGIQGNVSGRAKHRWSIFKKITRQGITLSEVADLLAFRVILPDLGSCYAALGMIHASYPPVPDKIKDYIARPKPNGYQSLHTTVIGPEGRRVEVQFRTADMHRVAEEGIAAHWRYKEGHLALKPEDLVAIAKIRNVFEGVTDAEDATEFMESVKAQFYADEVFIFTPGGDVKRFPMGATALDFAYAVHSKVGHHCTGAKVNGRMVPLRYVLKSGDTVEILTSQNQEPNRDWLAIAKTSRAISKIRRHLRQRELEQGARLGRDMLESELRRSGWSMERVKRDGNITSVLKKRGLADLDQLLVEVAKGGLTLQQVARDLLPEGEYQTRQEEQQGFAANLLGRLGRRTATVSPVLISGEDGLLVTFARCCSPLPGEPVVGFITRGRGITVHKGDCDQLETMDADRRIPVEWDQGSEIRHSGTIEIFCTDRPGMLANITKLCEQQQVNINRAEARNMADDRANVSLELSVRDVGELTRLIRNIEKIKGVDAVHRVIG